MTLPPRSNNIAKLPDLLGGCGALRDRAR